MTTKEYKIEGMSCGHCVKAVEIELSKLNVDSKEIEIGKVKVSFDDSKISDKDIVNSIEEAGFKVIQ